MSDKVKHVLGISGGKDSAALAVYMRDNYPEIDIDYFFTDTGKELPEVYSFLSKLEGYLGKPILRINPNRDFDFWLMQHNNFLPSAQARWCTICMKLKPFEEWVGKFLKDGYTVYSYVAIRSDEEFREGYQSRDENLKIKMPFRENGIDRKGVIDILNKVKNREQLSTEQKVFLQDLRSLTLKVISTFQSTFTIIKLFPKYFILFKS